ncbi:MAG: VOC family protein [Propionibacteriaceae bacterium]
MTTGLTTIIYPVQDLARAKTLYTTLLGAEPVMDAPYYVGYRIGTQDVGLDPNSPTAGPVGYWNVDDIEHSVQELLAAGATVQRPVSDVGGGKLVATVQDLDGNLVGLIQA